MPEEKVVMYESPEAASIQIVTGWVGATHRRCEKNPDHPIFEVRRWCEQCYPDSRQAKFAAIPV